MRTGWGALLPFTFAIHLGCVRALVIYTFHDNDFGIRRDTLVPSRDSTVDSTATLHHGSSHKHRLTTSGLSSTL